MGRKNAQLVFGSQAASQGFEIGGALQGRAIGGEQADRLFRRLIEQLDPKVCQSGGKESPQVRYAALRAGIENRISATHIGADGMGLAYPVSHRDAVTVTRAATGEVILALGEEGGKNAVLHMKHGDVLVEGELKPFGWCDAEKFQKLADVEVVTGSESLEAFLD